MKKWMQTGGGGVVNFYYGIPRVWKDNAIWKFRRQGEGGGVKYGSHCSIIGMDIFWNHPFSDTYKT